MKNILSAARSTNIIDKNWPFFVYYKSNMKHCYDVRNHRNRRGNKKGMVEGEAVAVER